MRVFISFPSEHSARALRLAACLRAERFDVFCSSDSIDDGDAWRKRIDYEMDRTRIFAVLFDPACLEKGRFFEIEVDLVGRRVGRPGLLVLPILLADARTENLPRVLQES